MSANGMTWDRARLERLKTAYNAANGKHDIFMFDGREFYIGYAKYLIEYLEGRLAPCERVKTPCQ